MNLVKKLQQQVQKRVWLRLMLEWPARVALGKANPGFHSSVATMADRRKWGRLAEYCRRRAVEQGCTQAGVHRALLVSLFQQRRGREAGRYAELYRSQVGLRAAQFVWLIGEFSRIGENELAARYYRALIEEYGTDFASRAPSPMNIPGQTPVNPDGQGAPLEASNGYAQSESVPGIVDLARLCFQYREFGIAETLYREASDAESLSRIDQLAWAYSASQSRGSLPAGIAIADLAELADTESVAPEWRLILASLAFAHGEGALARSCVCRAAVSLYGDIATIDDLTADFLDMLASIESMPARMPIRVKFGVSDHGRGGAPPKVFVSGFGWSGSGAVYDRLREHDAFCEFPGVQDDPVLNEDADREVMFIQGPNGLGELWRAALGRKVVTRDQCWQLFVNHAIGGCYFGYREYKSAVSARWLTREMGCDYTRAFRRMFRLLVAAGADQEVVSVQGVLHDLTDSLCRSLQKREGKDVVLFNNAIFSHNLDMLAVCRNARLVSVYRDPRDQFVDRRNNDKNHWMPAVRFVDSYKLRRERFDKARKRLAKTSGNGVLKVSFELFVLNEPYRDAVVDWVFDDDVPERWSLHFAPEVSARNIGLYKGSLSDDELKRMKRALATRRMTDSLATVDRLAASAAMLADGGGLQDRQS